MPTYQILTGDSLTLLRQLPDNAVNCCITSPPYWQQRDYGCAGQLGLEATPSEYVANLTEIFREVRRVLTRDGTLWLNLGDTYFGDSPVRKRAADAFSQQWDRSQTRSRGGRRRSAKSVEGLKKKDLVGIPWRVALALQQDGWYLRSDIIWAKSNVMPSSVKDRPTPAHEYLFLLTRSANYYYDQDAILEPLAPGSAERYRYRFGGAKLERLKSDKRTAMVGFRSPTRGRNKRTVWTVPPSRSRHAHAATFPPQLVEPCVLAGCPESGLILDPFNGTGTTALVALAHHRNYLGLELNPKYVKITHHRLATEIFTAL